MPSPDPLSCDPGWLPLPREWSPNLLGFTPTFSKPLPYFSSTHSLSLPGSVKTLGYRYGNPTQTGLTRNTTVAHLWCGPRDSARCRHVWFQGPNRCCQNSFHLLALSLWVCSRHAPPPETPGNTLGPRSTGAGDGLFPAVTASLSVCEAVAHSTSVPLL